MDNGNIDLCGLQTFRRLLISKLQDEFENRTRNVESESRPSVIFVPLGAYFTAACPLIATPLLFFSHSSL